MEQVKRQRQDRLEVGKPYIPGIKKFPEGIEFGWSGDSGRMELCFFWPGVSDREIESFAKGEAEFALYYENPVLLLLYRIEGAADWSDLSYSLHISPEECRDIPAENEQCEGLTLRIVLTDADTGIVMVVRDLVLSPQFSETLLAKLRDQSQEPYNPLLFNQVLDDIYNRYPDPDEVLLESLICEKASSSH
jgi:hypothetical protein